jgi:hypothetical protein
MKNKQPSSSEGVPTIALPRALTPALLESLLGKSPLRRIAARFPDLDTPHLYLETLECGHQVHSFQDFEWNPGLKWLPMSSIRRRCRECSALAKKKPVQSCANQAVKGVA